MTSAELVAILTTVVPAVAITLGTIVPAWVEGRAVLKALEGMVRQPEMAPQLRATLFVSMALLESTAIYVLLICLILIFAHPILGRLF